MMKKKKKKMIENSSFRMSTITPKVVIVGVGPSCLAIAIATCLYLLKPRCSIEVEEAIYDVAHKRWCIKGLNKVSRAIEYFEANFLVIASDENSQGFILDFPGLNTFVGEFIHSFMYRSGASYCGKNVLVVGADNSGMEIAYDLFHHGAKSSISIRSQVHVMTKEQIHLGMVLANYLPVAFVDKLLLMLANFKFGDLSKYGIVMTSSDPFALKAATSRSAAIDVGTIGKIKIGDILVVKEPIIIDDSQVEFSDGKMFKYDVIIFATGYRSLANTWLKDDTSFFEGDGFPKG